jgi:hypothetical protein
MKTLYEIVYWVTSMHICFHEVTCIILYNYIILCYIFIANFRARHYQMYAICSRTRKESIFYSPEYMKLHLLTYVVDVL